MARFARYFDRSPARLGPEEIRSYQVYLTNERRLAPSSLVVVVSALRFLYRVTLRKRWAIDDVIPAPKKPRSLPVVLSPEEVVQFLDGVKAARHRAILTTCYAAGLRISEAVRLTVSAIDSQWMVLRIAKGKGEKDRYVMLSPKLLAILRDWWKVERPRHWLFPGERPEAPIRRAAVQRACQIAARRARLAKAVSPHALRHNSELGITTMPLRSISSRQAPTCVRFSSCSDIGVCGPRRSTCGSPAPRSARPQVRWICSRDPRTRTGMLPARRLSDGRAPRRAHRGGDLPPLRRYLPDPGRGRPLGNCRTYRTSICPQNPSHPTGSTGVGRTWCQPTEYFHVVFTVPPAVDGDRIRDRATYERPQQPSEGTVNGRFAVQDGDATGALAGRSIRGRSARYAADLCPAGRLLARCAAFVKRVAEWLYRAYPRGTLRLRFGG